MHGTRGSSRGKPGKARGLDGQPLVPQAGAGMTLQDYAVGGAWGTGGAWQSNGGKENQSSAGNPRIATAPCWRKPKAQRIDEKVQKLMTSYKESDQGANPFAQTDSQRRGQAMQKYFPGKDIPLGARDEGPPAELEDEYSG